ncbi:mucin-2-like isoform X2 [Cylas formicarius]|uniref:mucin-2-like isoform X2 n=1 Tax=Cylas formicarius TaxID=197179 RepID=UPI0029589536|nr:mucin-2-like isoform X2 [Cylas formicarius]
MKILHLLLLFFFALQISGQRTRAPPADQGTNGAERTTQPRGRGRTRFSATQEYSDTSDLSDSGRRANSRARTATNANRATTINGNRASTTSGTRSSSNGLTSSRTSNFNGNRVSTNTGSRSSERRSRPTEQPTGYAVQEILNESPIDSFRRQSRPRVLTESRFDPVIPPRRTTTESVELVRDEAVEEFVSTFGSTARAILSARGEVPPPPPSRTTTPKIDEEYLSTFGDAVRSLVPAKVTTSRVDDEYLNSFGNTIRSIAASRGAVVASGRASPSRTINRNEVQQQRATPLRSETPILNEEDIPLQKPSLRDPLPSLRGSDSDLTQTQSLRSSSRNRGQDRIQEAGTNDRYEPQRRVALDSIEDVRYEPERRVVEEPANVKYQPPSEVLEQGLVDLKEEITGINSGEAPIEEISVEEEPQIITPLKPTEPPQSRRVQQVGGQRSNTRGRTVEYESQPATIQRSRSSLNRANQRAETASNVQVSRGRGARRRYEDVSAAESKTRGPSIFTEEEYQVVNTRSRTGRRIGADLEKSIDLSPTTTRSRTSGRRATTAKSGGRYTNVDYGVKSVTGSKELPTISSRRSKLVSKDDLTTPSRRNNIASGVSVTNTQSRSRLGDITTINEDRLEVLPLFDRESRVVAPSSRTRGGSSRRQNSVNDSFQASATENDMRFVQKPSSAVTRVSVSMTQSVEPRTPPTTRAATRRIPTTPSVPVTARPTTSTLRTTITTTTAKPTTRRAPLIKESVIAEYNEVTSKSTITRRKKGDKLKTEPNTSRGYKKSNSKGTVGNKKISEEDVDEEENYPAAFKALIQAKKIDGGVGKPSQSESSHIVGNAKSVVTSSLPKSSTASRTVTAEAAGTRKGLQAENFHENEIDSETKFSPATPSSTGRPTRNRQLTKAADKKRKLTSSTVQTASVNNNKRKYTRQPPSENHPKRKQLRSTAVPPSTTPIPASKIDTRVPAKFVKKDSSSTYARNGQNDTRNPTGDLEPAKPTIPFKKFNKYSSRYRNELTARSNQLKSTTNAPFYVPTIPTPAYVPTVPTITPPITTVPLRERRRHRGDVLELEAITFDDPVNTIASASLVSEEPRSVDNTIKLTPLVKDGTTEKPVSIIERIINSITSISTTPSPNVTTAAVTKTADDNESSAILKLAPKKSNVKDKTRQDDKQNSSVIESLTSEKPTTIIEKILSSLSAIQTNEVGTSNFNTVSSSSTTPLSAATKFSAKYRVSSVGITTTTLPAHLPISTSVNPLNVFDEIDENQVLEKRTIGKLLDILNGLASGKTSQKLVVVTPKTVHSGTTFSDKELSTYPITFVTGAPQSQEPLEALPVSAISDDFALVGNDLPSVNIDAPSSTEFVSTTTEPSSSAISSSMLSVFTDTAPTSTTPNSFFTTPTEIVDIESTTIAPIFTEQSNSATTTQDAVSANTSEPVETTTSQYKRETTTTPSGSHIYSIPASLPTPVNFEVSPGSVLIISANDVSNPATSDDNQFNTVTIASRIGNLDNTLLTSTTTDSFTTAEATTEMDISTIATEGTTDVSTIEIATSTTEEIPITVSPTTWLPSTNKSDRQFNRAGRILANDVGAPVGNSIDISTPPTTTSTTPDYFVFAVLNNNTILRKKPPIIPKEVPFVILGLYPNNTVVRKFPNGTVVPMEQVIKVRGFDTRPNPPPLPEITSNQVTDLNGLTSEDDNRVTVDRNEMSRMNMNPLALTSTPRPSTSSQSVSTVIINPTILPPNTPTPPIVAPTSTKGEEISLAASTTTTESTQVTTEVSPAVTSTQSQTTSRPTIPPTLSELLNGKTLEALDNIIKTDPSSPKKPNYETLTVNKYNEVLNIQDLLNKNNRGKPVKKESSQSDTLTQTSTQRQIAPFTSPLVTTEQWFSFPTTEQATSSELASTFAPTTNRISETTITTERIPEVTTTESTTKSISTTTTTTQPSSASTTVEPRIRATTPLATIIPSTILPTLFSTLFPTLVRGTTNPPLSSTKAFSTTTDYDDKYEVLSFAGTTVQPTTVAPTITSSPLSQGISTTTQPTTTSTEPTTTTVRTTTPKKATTTAKTESSATVPTDFAKAVKLKELTAEQRKNLEEIAKLEKQQAELLRQLNFLTSVFGGPSLKMPNAANAGGSGLANRVINMAVARDKTRSTTTPSTKRTTKRPNSIQDQLSAVQDSPSGNETATLEEIFKQLNLTGLTSTTPASTKTTPSLEEILKQYNLTGVSTPEPLTSTYGKSDEAILATLLKEQGIGPSTPKALADQIKEAGATTKASKPKPKSRPRTTTQRPGRLMQGLNWLLDLLDPPTTRRPATRKPASRKPKPKTTTTTEGATKVPEKETSEEELLSHQPTRITPVVTTAPNEIMTKPELSQSEIRALIKQLEAIQRNPKSSDQLDFSKIKSLQNLLDVKDGVEVISPGQHGTTLRGVNTASGKPKEVKRVPVKSTTVVPFSVSNKIEDEESLPTSTVSSTAIPPVRLNPVVGIDDDPSDPFIRSNLITAAVGVTRAISNFFGTAFQGAARGFQNLLGAGSSMATRTSGASFG